MKNTNKRGLFHPNDIKTLGIRAASPGPRTAPLPDTSTPSTRAKPSISPVSTKQPLPPSLGRSHSRSSSFAGSVGRAEARRLKSQSEFGKYTEEDDEEPFKGTSLDQSNNVSLSANAEKTIAPAEENNNDDDEIFHNQLKQWFVTTNCYISDAQSLSKILQPRIPTTEL